MAWTATLSTPLFRDILEAMMMLMALVIVGTGFAQPETPRERERQTHLITLSNGTQWPVYWEERAEVGSGVLRVELDTPWEPVVRTVKNADVTDIGIERPSARKERLEKGWREAGFVDVNGRFVSAAEKEWADKARETAGVTESRKAAAPDPENAPEKPATITVQAPLPQTASRTGRLVQWGPHVGIAVIALLLSGLVARMMIFTGSG